VAVVESGMEVAEGAEVALLGTCSAVMELNRISRAPLFVIVTVCAFCGSSPAMKNRVTSGTRYTELAL
jgi:hypothetical protein